MKELNNNEIYEMLKKFIRSLESHKEDVNIEK